MCAASLMFCGLGTSLLSSWLALELSSLLLDMLIVVRRALLCLLLSDAMVEQVHVSQTQREKNLEADSEA